jgi:hypothetical protein
MDMVTPSSLTDAQLAEHIAWCAARDRHEHHKARLIALHSERLHRQLQEQITSRLTMSVKAASLAAFTATLGSE